MVLSRGFAPPGGIRWLLILPNLNMHRKYYGVGMMLVILGSFSRRRWWPPGT
jgi:hypothetical protein